MTRKEAIKVLKEYLALDKDIDSEYLEAQKVAIQALEEAKEFNEYLKNQQESILDKIKSKLIEEKECAYADFERYKVEYLGQSWEDVLDSLPQDDFRYGMERCIEIIDKYRTESECKK